MNCLFRNFRIFVLSLSLILQRIPTIIIIITSKDSTLEMSLTTLLVCCFVSVSWFQVIIGLEPNEIAILKELYISLDGNQWTWTTSMTSQIWNFTAGTTSDPCKDLWYGITCYYNQSSNSSTVKSIELGNIHLQGTIPSSITNLLNLTIFNVSNNYIDGTIPNINDTQLQILDLKDNLLTGLIPNFNLPQLTYLDLSHTILSGSIPDLVNLPQLAYLDLSLTSLSGSLPEVLNFPGLIYLNLSQTSLTGAIPDLNDVPQLIYLDLSYTELFMSMDDFADLNQLSYFDLSNTGLAGTLPIMSNFPQLRYVDFSSTALSGTLPMFSDFPLLSHLDLSDTAFTGTIPLFSDLPLLSFLDLSAVILYPPSGTIPEFSNVPLLNHLDLSENSLSGSIPSFANVSQLSYLDFSSNQLSGLIPDLSYLAQLSYFDVQANDLSGTIHQLIELPQLSYLDLSFNHLSGSIPAFLDLPQLTYLDLSRNELYGTLQFMNLSQLSSLKLASNSFSGTLSNLMDLPELNYLDLSVNQITGIPELINLPQLSYFSLSSNSLTGTIPNFNQLPQLTSLQLDVNDLTGSIPDFDHLPLLSKLLLDSNRLSGSIPDFENLPQLSYLDLSSNSLSGTIPNFQNLPLLTDLRLKENKLTGSIPDFDNLPQLFLLLLDTNYLTGKIPDFSNFPQLLTLQLDTNDLTGSIPNFSNIPQLSNLVLYSNHLSGTISDFSNLPFLSEIEFSDNRLHGTIPDFSNLFELYVLQIAENHLTGTIPNFGNLTQLGYLDLSSNQLSGSIPLFENLSQLNFIYLGDNYLTRSIPPFTSDLNLISFPHNYLSGTLSLSSENFNALNTLLLSENTLSGDIAAFTTTLPSLILCSLNGNQFTGSIEQLFNVSLHTSLSIIDVSDNQLHGTISREIFQLMALKIFSAGKNCIAGSLPTEICSATQLIALSLDGLGTAESCQDHFFPHSTIHTYRVRHLLTGSIPSCLFELPYLQVLHLSGNGFTGTIPEKLLPYSNLTDLSLSYNRVGGTLPYHIQAHPWESFDISVNKVNGILWQNLPPLNNRSRFSLFVNRLSGSLPESLFNQSLNVNILDGNLFDCKVNEEDGQNILPASDPNHASYTCGSQSVDDAIIVWIGFSFVCCIAFVACFVKCLPRNERVRRLTFFPELEAKCRLWWIKASKGTGNSKNNRLSRGITVNPAFHLIRRFLALLFLLIVVIFLPLYGSLSKFRTHSYSYVWIVSLAYISGQTPAIILLVIFFLCFAISIGYVYVLHDHSLAIQDETLTRVAIPKEPSRIKNFQQRWPVWIAKCVIICINTVVMMATNIGYVYFLSLSLTQTQRTSLQICVAIIKLIWGVAFIRQLYLFTMKKIERSNRMQESVEAEDTASIFNRVQFLSLLNIFNFIIAPILAIAFFDSNCFKNIVFTPSEVQTSYYATFQDLNGPLCNDCPGNTYQSSFSYLPPFIYNYQCTSSLLADFVTVFVYKYALSTFLILLRSFCLVLILKYRFSSKLFVIPFLPKQIRFTLLKLKKKKGLWIPFAPIENAIGKCLAILFCSKKGAAGDGGRGGEPEEEIKNENDNKCFDGDIIMIGLVGDFSILVTFGIVFPPLGIIICFWICLQTVFHQLLLGRLLCELEDSLQENSTVREALERSVSESHRHQKNDNNEDNKNDRAAPPTPLSLPPPHPWHIPEEYFTVLKKETSPLWKYFQPSIKYLAILSAIFVSFFLFDILGDEVGINGAIWIIPVTSCFPLVMVILHQMVLKFYQQCQREQKKRKKSHSILPLNQNEEEEEEEDLANGGAERNHNNSKDDDTNVMVVDLMSRRYDIEQV